MDDVDEAIAALLPRAERTAFQKLPGSRASAFAELDAPALSTLAAAALGVGHLQDACKVHIDYHVEVDGHRYSVPHALVGQELEARVTDALVELLHRGQRVASHAAQRAPRRLHHRGRTHAGGAPRAPGVDARAADPLGAEHRRRHRRSFVTRLLQRASPPRARLPRLPGAAAAWPSAMAGRGWRPPACVALELGAGHYRHVRDILANGARPGRARDAPRREWISPEHANVRGPELLPLTPARRHTAQRTST